MSKEHVKRINEDRIAAVTKKVLSPFVIGEGSLDLRQLIGLRNFDGLEMSLDKSNPNVLDFSFNEPGNEKRTLINVSASIDESEPMNTNHQFISIDFVHRFLDGDRGFRLYYQPDDMVNAPDHYTLKHLQILPRKGESSYPSDSKKAGDEIISADVTVFPGLQDMICIEDINPDMTHKNLPSNFPYSLKYSSNKPDDVILIAHDDGRYCQWPFNITLPARIGFSKEKFQKVLKQVKKI